MDAWRQCVQGAARRALAGEIGDVRASPRRARGRSAALAVSQGGTPRVAQPRLAPVPARAACGTRGLGSRLVSRREPPWLLPAVCAVRARRGTCPRRSRAEWAFGAGLD